MTFPADDRGFTLGDGLFETVLAQDGKFVFWDEHVTRLVRGCEVLGLPAPDNSRLLEEVETAIKGSGLTHSRAAVRISWTAGSGGRGLERPASLAPGLVVMAAPSPEPSGPLHLATATIRRNETSPSSRLKTLSYLDNVMARREAAAVGADEALMLNTRGEIACAAAANIFWITGGVLCTPSLDCGVLDGIIRERVIALAGVEVRQVREGPQVLADAEAVFLTNSLIGIRAVNKVDGRVIGGGEQVDALRKTVLSSPNR